MTGQDCVIGSSNRGGRRVRKRTLDQAGLDGSSQLSQTSPSVEVEASTVHFTAEP